ncbi:Holliday junction resolvase RuvX [Candidatus Photodesmus blepharus]|uniref:Holliday junction resolvase RuvX n=1 Tax=Candidatus Photodesmus blepharonis TaxID=1179155 RepID=UPI0005513979|nr:Holliday junction resolvase RuvX [Candidatus Photodesmus blepharus]
MSRTIMAFDFGTKNIGSAIGQEITQTASPLRALKADDGVPNWYDIKKQITEWKPDLLIVGLPTDLNGKNLRNITQKAKKFAKHIQSRYCLSVELHDERFSTSEARSSLFDIGGYKALSKDSIDCRSAVIILESWLKSQKKMKNMPIF